MSKKRNNSGNTADFSLNTNPVSEKNSQDNGFFFENEDVLNNDTDVQEKTPSKENGSSSKQISKEKTVEKTEDKSVKKSDKNSEVKEKSNSQKENSKKTENDSQKDNKKSDGSIAYFIKIAGALTLICSFVALMLAAVNMITKDTIAENAVNEKKAAVTQIFKEADDAYSFAGYSGEEEIFLAEKDNKLYGYCVSVVTQGYGGEISMMVGIRSDGKVEGIKIVSMSETAGLGSKTKNDSFLSQYIDKYGPFTVGSNIDAVAGATVSSKAVTAGVNAALSVPITPSEIAARRGMEIYHEDSASSEDSEETSAETEASSEDTTVANGADKRQEILDAMTQAAEDTHIDPASAGQYQTKYYYEEEKSYTANRENGHYLEKETTDTEEETSESPDTEI